MTYLALEIHIPDKEIINTAHSYLVSTALSSLSQLKSPLMTWIAKELTIIVYIRDRYKQQQQQQQNINKLEEISHLPVISLYTVLCSAQILKTSSWLPFILF